MKTYVLDIDLDNEDYLMEELQIAAMDASGRRLNIVNDMRASASPTGNRKLRVTLEKTWFYKIIGILMEKGIIAMVLSEDYYFIRTFA